MKSVSHIFELLSSTAIEVNPRNWTYITPEIYLSDMHDENVIKEKDGTVYVLVCDIRLNTPDLNKGGVREFSNSIESVS